MTFCFSLSINFFFFFYLKYTRIIYTDEHTQRTIWLKHLSFLSFFFFFFPNEACKRVVVSPVRMKIKRVGWWIVINDSGGTVKTFPFLFPVWTTELLNPAVYGMWTWRYCCCCLLLFVIGNVTVCCSRCFNYVLSCVRKDRTHWSVPRSHGSRWDLVRKIPFERFQSSIIDTFRTIHDFCASSVDFIMTDDSQ